MRFGDKLQKLINRRGVRQVDLAAQIGRAQSRISKWINGTGEPTPRDLWLLSKALGVSLRFLCDEDLEDFTRALETDAPGQPLALSSDEQLVYALVRKLGPEAALRRLIAEEHAAQAEAAAPQYRKPVGPPAALPPARERKKDPEPAPASKYSHRVTHVRPKGKPNNNGSKAGKKKTP